MTDPPVTLDRLIRCNVPHDKRLRAYIEGLRPPEIGRIAMAHRQ
ncbi:hypothetical protein [Pseudomonas sp. MWU12-2029]|nr:hypothetical protein [Pseudomonas sp. MWU12-2029]